MLSFQVFLGFEYNCSVFLPSVTRMQCTLIFQTWKEVKYLSLYNKCANVGAVSLNFWGSGNEMRLKSHRKFPGDVGIPNKCQLTSRCWIRQGVKVVILDAMPCMLLSWRCAARATGTETWQLQASCWCLVCTSIKGWYSIIKAVP